MATKEVHIYKVYLQQMYPVSKLLLIFVSIITDGIYSQFESMHIDLDPAISHELISITMISVATLILVIASYLFWKNWQGKKYLRGIPEPPTNPILGHVTEVASTTEIISGAFRLLKYGKTFKIRIGPAICPLRAIVTIDYKFIEFILSSNTMLTKSRMYWFLKDWLHNGLLLSDGEYWKRHRKILTPTFHFEILKHFVEVFERVGNVFIEKLEQYDGTDSVNLPPLVTLCTLDIICETAMGTKLNVQSGENAQYVQSVKEMCRIAVTRAFSVGKIFKCTYMFTRDYFKEKKHLKILHGFTKDVIDSKRGIKKAQKSKRMAFLDLLLKFSEKEDMFSNDELQEEVDTFMFAGHDTTASGISFTLYCLADHPEIQEKVLQEQRDLFGNEKDPTITYADLQSMKFLENVIKETFRLYPPILTVGRLTTEDVKFGDCLIPKNVDIIIFIYGLHRDPEYFPEPERFIPERFDTIDGTKPYAYIPFSAGPRNCIGQKFAMLELKSIISKVVRHFEIRPTTPRHEMKLSFEAVLKSANGIKVALKKRS